MRWGVFGAAAAVVASALLSTPAPSRPLQSRVSLTLHAHQTGELAVTPFGAILDVRNLTVARPRSTTIAVRNISGAPVRVRARAVADNADADGVLALRVSTPRRALIDASLGRARRWSASALRIDPGQTRTLTVALSVAPATATGLIGRAGDLTLELNARRVAR